MYYEELHAAPPGAAAAAASPTPRTVCVLHGVLGTGRNLRGVVQDLCRQAAEASGQPWRALLLDLRCHGRSARAGLAPPHTLPAAAHDVVRLWCQQLGGRAPDVLVGHSMGGKTALEIVRQLAHPGAPTGQPRQVSGGAGRCGWAGSKHSDAATAAVCLHAAGSRQGLHPCVLAVLSHIAPTRVACAGVGAGCAAQRRAPLGQADAGRAGAWGGSQGLEMLGLGAPPPSRGMAAPVAGPGSVRSAGELCWPDHVP